VSASVRVFVFATILLSSGVPSAFGQAGLTRSQATRSQGLFKIKSARPFGPDSVFATQRAW
jgi:hypothetical protein